jgi:diguanylate cyclase (GGDEF)-like protein
MSSNARVLDFRTAASATLSHLCEITKISNWVLTRTHNDGVVVSVSSSAGRKAHQHRGSRSRQRPFPVLTADVYDGLGLGLFGTLIGYVTDIDTPRAETALPALIAQASSFRPLVDLFASMLTSVLSVERLSNEQTRSIERSAEGGVDALTGLHERSSWVRLLELESARINAFEDDAIVVLVDVLELHEINRSQGYEAGNEVLREVALTLRNSVPDHRLLARLRSDDFGVLLHGPNPSQQLLSLRRGFAEAGVAVSVGVGQRGAGEHSLMPAVERADRSMGSRRRLHEGSFAFSH